jgi:hypothetical protein
VHVLVDGLCVTCRTAEAARGHFNPELHPHDPHSGEFVSTVGKDLLKLLRTGDDAVRSAPYQRHVTRGGRGGFTSEQIDQSLTGYAFSWYRGINRALREHDNDSGFEDAIAHIDAAMGPISHDVQVYRGVRDPQVVFGDAWNDHDVTGLRWRDDAYASTSGSEGTAKGDVGGAGKAEVVMHMRVPKGTPAVGMSTGEHSEQELLLGRGLGYRVIADHGGTPRVLDVEVVGG